MSHQGEGFILRTAEGTGRQFNHVWASVMIVGVDGFCTFWKGETIKVRETVQSSLRARKK